MPVFSQRGGKLYIKIFPVAGCSWARNQMLTFVPFNLNGQEFYVHSYWTCCQCRVVLERECNGQGQRAWKWNQPMVIGNLHSSFMTNGVERNKKLVLSSGPRVHSLRAQLQRPLSSPSIRTPLQATAADVLSLGYLLFVVVC